jgi:hypothetical protein
MELDIHHLTKDSGRESISAILLFKTDYNSQTRLQLIDLEVGLFELSFRYSNCDQTPSP